MRQLILILAILTIAARCFQEPIVNTDFPTIETGSFSLASLGIGRSTITLAFAKNFAQAPFFGIALYDLSVAAADRYQIQPLTGFTLTSSGAQMDFVIDGNQWSKVKYVWLASAGYPVFLKTFTEYSPKIGKSNELEIPEIVSAVPSTFAAGKFKVDILIAGFDICADDKSTKFALKVTPKRGSKDTNYNDYVESGNIDKSAAIKKSILEYNVETIARHNINYIVATVYVHFLAIESTLISTGFNTISAKTPGSYNVFEAENNKNNLANPPLYMYGFTELKQPATVAVDAAINLKNVRMTDLESAVNLELAAASFYFYQRYASDLCVAEENSGRQDCNSPLVATTSGNMNGDFETGLPDIWKCVRGVCKLGKNTVDKKRNFYVLSANDDVPATISTPVILTTGKTYKVTLKVLDLGKFKTPTITVKLQNKVVFFNTETKGSPWTNPTAGKADANNVKSYKTLSGYYKAFGGTSLLEITISQDGESLTDYYLADVIVTFSNTIYDPKSGKCLATCPKGQELNMNTQPPSCWSPCANHGREWDDDDQTCVCSFGSFDNQGFCQACLGYNCKTCTADNPTVCTKCTAPRVLNDGKCVCGEGFYQRNGLCFRCNSGCSSCNSEGVCATCSINSYRVDLPVSNTCPCLDGYYDNGQNACTSCPAICNTCSLVLGSLVCNTCRENINREFKDGRCECKEGYYALDVLGACMACHSTCGSCSGPNSDQCITCSTNSNRVMVTTLKGLECQCPFGYRALPGSSVCVKTGCDSDTTCTSCKGDGTCELCNSDLNRILNPSTKKCDCKAGFYLEKAIGGPQGSCLACSTACLSCNSAGCTNCFPGATKLSDGTCVCPVGKFPDYVTYKCKSCPTGCKSCSANGCETCLAPQVRINGECKCPQGFFQPLDKPDSCQACATLNCQACSNTTTCLACKSGFVVYNGLCVKSCPVGTYNDGWSCQTCTPGCTKCNGPNSCISCLPGFVAENGICCNSCPTGKYPVNGGCAMCSSECETCVDGKTCSSCKVGNLIQGKCTSQCPTGSIPVAGSCTACNPTCLTCFGTPSSCTSCLPNYFLDFDQKRCVTQCEPTDFVLASTCYNICPAGYFGKTNRCYECSENCMKCTDSAKTCTACRAGNYLYNSTCVSKCPNSLVPINGECKKQEVCINGSNCYKCQGATYYDAIKGCVSCPSGCTSCISATVCEGCVKSTDTLVNGVCKSCSSPCKTCATNAPTVCTSCVNGRVLIGDSCAESRCPNNMVNDNGVCKCASGLLANGKECVITCPAGQGPFQGRCVGCPSGCTTCTESIDKCTSCSPGYSLSQGQCVADINVNNCPYGMYSSWLGYCISICETGKYYYNGFCVWYCPTGTLPNREKTGCLPQEPEVDCINCPAAAIPPINCALSNSFAFGDQCVTVCPQGYVGLKNKCQKCPENCAFCDSIDKCSLCNPGFYPNKGVCTVQQVCNAPLLSLGSVCVSTCPAGTYPKQGSCITVCPKGTYYLDGFCFYQCPPELFRTNYACVDVCPTKGAIDGICTDTDNIGCPIGQFYEVSSKSCKPCKAPCAACVGKATTCLSCLTGTFQNGTCKANAAGSVSLKLILNSSSIVRSPFGNVLMITIDFNGPLGNLSSAVSNQFFDVLITQGTGQVYQQYYPDTNRFIVFILCPTGLAPSTQIRLGINIAAAGPTLNALGYTDLNKAVVAVNVADMQESSTLIIPSGLAPTYAKTEDKWTV